MLTLSETDPVAAAAIAAIRQGDLAGLKQVLGTHPDLAGATIVRAARGGCAPFSYPLLGAATDWPGHFPNVRATIEALIAAGANVHACCAGPHQESPLHGAASSDDLEALDALLDAGADIEAAGGVIGGGTPLADAVAFGQWQAARRLVERGARATLWQAAGLGLVEVLEQQMAQGPVSLDELTGAFWCACHGGQQQAAAYLLDRGADLHWIGYDGLTPLEAALRSGADDLAEWLRGLGARSSAQGR